MAIVLLQLCISGNTCLYTVQTDSEISNKIDQHFGTYEYKLRLHAL